LCLREDKEEFLADSNSDLDGNNCDDGNSEFEVSSGNKNTVKAC